MSMSKQAPRQHGGKNVFRLVAATSTAAVLLGSSFYAAQAGSGAAGQYRDDLDGSNVGNLVGITAGAALGVYFIAGAIDRDNDKDKDSTSGEKEKSAKSGKVEQVRVLPSQNSLVAGDSSTVQVQARFQGSQTWQNVTDNASIRLVSGSLTQVDGTKNAFAVPYGNKVVAGPATVEASFGGKSATAEFRVN
jgi:hypothetical protein